MDFVGAIKSGFQNYANFRGVATRSEYWYWVLFNFLVGLVAQAIDYNSDFPVVGSMINLVFLLPSLAVAVRRLRDAGYNWKWLLSSIPGGVLFTVGLIGIAVNLYAYSLNNSLITDSSDPNFVMEQIQQLMSDPAFVGYLITFFVGLLILFAYLVVVQIIFMVQPSKSFEQGNKQLAPKNPVI